MSAAIEKILPRLEVFNFLEEDDYPIIVKYMFSYDYDSGAYVFKEGAHGAYMFFIVSGEVEIIKQFDTAKHIIAKLGTGRSVGEMSLIDGAPRSATARAKTALKLIVLKREDFNKLNAEHPAIAVLGNMYTESLGPWARSMFVVGAFVVLYDSFSAFFRE